MPRRIKIPKITLSDYRSKIFSWLIFILIILLIFWQLYTFGQRHAEEKLVEQKTLIGSLTVQVNDLEIELSALQSANARLERTSQIDKTAVKEVREQLVKLQEKQSDLIKQMEFYKSVLSGSVNSLRILRASLKKTNKKKVFRYYLQISKRSKNKKIVSGELILSVSGLINDKLEKIDYKKLGLERRKQNIKFKHYQIFEGNLKIPDNFIPKKFHVKMIPKSKLFEITEKTFTWQLGKL